MPTTTSSRCWRANPSQGESRGSLQGQGLPLVEQQAATDSAVNPFSLQQNHPQGRGNKEGGANLKNFLEQPHLTANQAKAYNKLSYPARDVNNLQEEIKGMALNHSFGEPTPTGGISDMDEPDN